MDAMGLVQRSFYGGVLILVILAVRAVLLGRLPKRTFPVLWGVALLRLLLPFSFSSIFSVYSLLHPAQIPEMTDHITYGMTVGVEAPATPFLWTPAPQNPALGEYASPASKGNLLSVLFVIWCVGAILCAVFFGLAYFRSLRAFRTAVPVVDGDISRWLDRRRWGHFIVIRQSDKISAPLTYGILRPVILLPERLVWENSRELEYVLQHEYVHICHCDATVKLATVAALCIHWFNPLVWLMSWLLNRDIELACDEGVLRRFGEQSRAGYAMTLIGMEEKKRGLLPLYNGFSKNAIEERIRLIMKYKKITYMTGLSALLLVLTIVLVFATSAEPAEATGNPENLSWNSPETDMTGGLMDPPKGSMVSDMSAPEENSQTNVFDSSAEDKEEGEPEGSEYVLSYMQEGLLQEEPADLYVGDGYCILLPREGWKSYAPDAWMWEMNDQVQIWVNDCSGSTWEQVAARLEEDGYHQTEDGVLEKESDGRLFYAEVKKSGFTLMCVNYTYPAEPEYIEGFVTLMHAIAANFAIMPDESDEGLSEDGKQIKQTVLAFWEAYLAGNPEGVKAYLAEDYDYGTWGIEVFPDGRDGHVAQEAQIQAVKGLDTEDAVLGETLEIWVEFRPAAGADYLEYLTMEVRKDQDGWKVLSYGLET